MILNELILANIDHCLEDTSFLGLPKGRKGKVRDIYDLDDSLLLIATDRLSAFDRVLACIPFKGQILNEVSAFWFDKTRDIIPNHVLDIPDPNVTIGRKCRVLPIEFVVRGYLTGSTSTSAWVQYSSGKRFICGNPLPDGMQKNEKFEKPILTPTTKSTEHDESITAEEIIARNIIDKKTWQQLEEIVLALFERGTQIAAKHDLILVDTKYEIGIDRDGRLTLIDEIHTPDSSRYWISETYSNRFKSGEEPDNIDKEFLRLWFAKHCDPYKDKILPAAPVDLIVELSRRYIQLYEMITGRDFMPAMKPPIHERLRANLAAYKT